MEDEEELPGFEDAVGLSAAPVAMALSPRSQLLVQAIQGPLQASLLQINSSVGSLTTNVQKLTAQGKEHDQRLSALEERMRKQEQSGRPASTASVEPGDTGGSRSASNVYDPGHISNREVLCIGGFPADCPKPRREAMTAQIFATAIASGDVVDHWAPGKYMSFSKCKFSSPARMWAWLKGNKGEKHHFLDGASSHQLWIAVEKNEKERTVGKRMSRAVLEFRRRAQTVFGLDEVQAKDAVEGDGTKVYCKHQGRLFRRAIAPAPGHASHLFIRLQRLVELGIQLQHTTEPAIEVGQILVAHIILLDQRQGLTVGSDGFGMSVDSGRHIARYL